MPGIWLIVIISFFPILLWWQYANFSSIAPIFLSFGQVAALTGIVLFSVNFVLASRFFWVEKLFKGLNKVYTFHHWTGAVAFSLLLMHPVFILWSYALISVDLAVSTLTPSLQNPAVLLGSTALAIFSLLLIITLFVKLPYHIWKITHQFLSLPLFLAGIHGLLIGSTLASSPLLKIYILGWVAAGLICALIRLFNVKLSFHAYDYKVSEVQIINNIIIIKMQALKQPLTYLPGQFIFVKFNSIGVTKEAHPFSLAGRENDNYLTIAVKPLGDYTETLKLLKPGATAKVEGPYGRFNQSYGKNHKQIWIAGGIGITPFRGMAFDAATKGNYEVKLYYTVSKRQEVVFDNEFSGLAEKNTTFSYELWVGEEKGRITAEIIKNKTGSLKETDIFICGPVPMMRSMTKQFNQLGVKNSRIHTEEFALY